MATKETKKVTTKKQVEKTLIEVALRIAREGKGCMFIIQDQPVKYKLLIENDIKPFNILEPQNKRRLEILALQTDGACIFDLKGNLIVHSANILNVKTLKGWGTRHSAGYTASRNGNIVILASEEDRKVREFKKEFKNEGFIQIDPYARNINKSIDEIVNVDVWESIKVGAVGSLGLTLIIPTLGIPLVTGVVFIGTGHFLYKFIARKK